jgi:hypothetical protein
MKGMRKVSRGSDFEGAVRYVFSASDKRDGPGRLLGGSFGMRSDQDRIIKQFVQIAARRGKIRRPVWHNSLRLPEGDSLDEGVWADLADQYMSAMGFSAEHPRIYVLHDDYDGQHIHIVASRVATDGKLYLGKNENLISTQVISKLEHQYGLRITKAVELDDEGRIVMPDQKQLRKGEIEKAMRTGVRPARLVLQGAVTAAKAGKPTLAQFIERLEAADVIVVANIASTGKFNGFAFVYGGQRFKASDLGDAFKWSKLQKEVSYVESRDREILAARSAKAVGRGADNEAAAAADFSATADHGRISDVNRASGTRHGEDVAVARVDRPASESAGDQDLKEAARTLHRLAKPAIERNRNRREEARLKKLREEEELLEQQRRADVLRRKLRNREQKNRLISADRPHWRQMRSDLLIKYYGQDSALLSQYFKIKRDAPSRDIVYENKIARVTDKGPMLTAGDGNSAEIEAMIELARLKNWKSISVTGSEAFKRDAMRAALLAGFEIETKTDGDAVMLRKLCAELNAARETEVIAAEQTRQRAEIAKRAAEKLKAAPRPGMQLTPDPF